MVKLNKVKRGRIAFDNPAIKKMQRGFSFEQWGNLKEEAIRYGDSTTPSKLVFNVIEIYQDERLQELSINSGIPAYILLKKAVSAYIFDIEKNGGNIELVIRDIDQKIEPIHKA